MLICMLYPVVGSVEQIVIAIVVREPSVLVSVIYAHTISSL